LNPLIFSHQSTNPNEQFFYFACLYAYLYESLGYQMPNDQQFSQFDDPNAIQQTIVESLKVLGMPEMTGAVKVRQAYGEQILQLFHRMTDLLLQRRGLTILQPLRFPVEYVYCFVCIG
jgi:estrogen-related receptor beta like 1